MPETPRVPDLSRVPDLEQLRALVETARTGSMSAAAKRLGISQQAVSARVRSAERLLRVAVFQRTTQGAEVTTSGTRVVAWAEDVLGAAARLEDGVAGLRTEDDTVVRVAASNTISEVLLPGWAARLRAERPGVQVQVSPGNSIMVLAAVARGDADLGFVEGPSVPRELSDQVVGGDHLMVVVPPDHRWAGLDGGIDRAELARTPLVQREEGSGTRTTFEDGRPGARRAGAGAVVDACGARRLPDARGTRRAVRAGRQARRGGRAARGGARARPHDAADAPRRVATDRAPSRRRRGTPRDREIARIRSTRLTARSP